MFCTSIRHATFFVHTIHVSLRTRGTKGTASGAAVISSPSLTAFQPCRMLTETLRGRTVPCDQFSILIDRHYGYDARAGSDVCNWPVTYTRLGTESRRFNSIEAELANASRNASDSGKDSHDDSLTCYGLKYIVTLYLVYIAHYVVFDQTEMVICMLRVSHKLRLPYLFIYRKYTEM